MKGNPHPGGFTPLKRGDLLAPNPASAGAPEMHAVGAPAAPRGPSMLLRPMKSASSDSVRQEWLAIYASGMAASEDYGVAVARDANGNVYVAGYGDSSTTGNDILTIKYSYTGIKQWSVRYNGVSNGQDRPSKIAVDGSGNVYVAGYSEGSGTKYDYVTLKYNSNGIQQWVIRYNGPANGDDFATALAIDGLGNVYVTGYSAGSGSGYDYATVKYNSNGVQQKVFRYNGTANGDDLAVAVGIDNSNSVYVAGYAAASGAGRDYVTIKYDAAGNQRWAVSFNGSGNGDDVAVGLGIDNAANVYVAGYSRGSGTGDDYATIKYDSSGTQKWVNTYNGPANGSDHTSAIAVDGAGNSFVTGSSLGSGTGYDYATIKYTTAGTQSWVQRYNGAFNGDDFASGITLDPFGSVYVTGSSVDASAIFFNEVTVTYSGTGIQQWNLRYRASQSNDSYPAAIVYDGFGHALVAGYSDLQDGSGYDIATVSYDMGGSQWWEARFDGPGISDDVASAVAADQSGNTYIAGYSRSSITGYDYVTVKYSAVGAQQWAERYDGPSSGDDIVSSLAIDDAGNVYVCGYSYDSSGTSSEYATVKYDPAGVQQWVARYSGLLESTNFAFDLAVGKGGDVVVTGTGSDSSGAAFDYITVKYNNTGAEQWVARYNGSGNGGDFAAAAAIDSSGNVFVTGASDESSNRGYDYGTVKYDATGHELWNARYNGPASDDDNASGIAVDRSGNVYVTGSSFGNGTLYDFATVKYNSSGSKQWVQRYNGSLNKDDSPAGIVLDTAGNVYLTGYSTNAGSATDFATIKYTPQGIERWVSIYNGTAGGNDQAVGLAVDGGGNVYVTGPSDGIGTSRDYATIRYDSLGVRKWLIRYDGSSSANDDAAGIAVDASGNVIVSGSSGFGISGSPTGGSAIATIKYRPVDPIFVLSRTGMNFAPVQIGCRSGDTLTISNPGLAPLLITSLVSDDPVFSVSPASLTVNAMSNALITVTFAPNNASAQTGHIIFTHNANGSPDTVTATGTSSDSLTGITIHDSLDLGWQLLSLPVGVVCPYVLDHLYAYKAGYVRHDTMVNGMAYWKKLAEPSLSFTGFPLSQETTQVAAQWNLVGSISSPAPVAAILTIPPGIISSPFFGYTSSGYTVADAIGPGKGYWVKTSQAGTMVFRASQYASGKNSVAQLFESIEHAIFTDAAGRSQTLYFGIKDGEDNSSINFELPPSPPPGPLNVRFSTGRIAALVRPGEPATFPIAISSAQFPVRFSCTRTGPMPRAWLRVGNFEKRLEATTTIEINEGDTPITLRLESVDGIPRVFSLDQNYPNPFNPSTTVRFTVGHRSIVTLKLYDVLGREVVTVVNEVKLPGVYRAEWDGRNYPSGVYTYRMQADGFTSVRKMLLIR